LGALRILRETSRKTSFQGVSRLASGALPPHEGYRGDMPGKPNPERDERVRLPLDPEAALRALLAVDPDDEPAETGQDGEPTAEELDAQKRNRGRPSAS
jgi:hypothetical protein